MELDLDDTARDLLGEAGFDPVYGARPLKRAIQQQIENPLSQQILRRPVRARRPDPRRRLAMGRWPSRSRARHQRLSITAPGIAMPFYEYECPSCQPLQRGHAEDFGQAAEEVPFLRQEPASSG